MLRTVLDEGMKLKIGGKRNKNTGGGVDHGGGGGATAKYEELEEQQPSHPPGGDGASNDAAVIQDEARNTDDLPKTEKERLVRIIFFVFLFILVSVLHLAINLVI